MISDRLIFDLASVKNLIPDFILLNEQQNIVQTSASLASFYTSSDSNKFGEYFTIEGKEKKLAAYFGKLLYFLLSDGMDKMKIGMSRFIREFTIFKKEDLHQAYNILAFRLYDIDRDGQLNIMNLLHLHMNI